MKTPRLSFHPKMVNPGSGMMAPPTTEYLFLGPATFSTGSIILWSSAIMSTALLSGDLILVRIFFLTDFFISDEAMGVYVRRPMAELFVQNYDGWGHRCDYANRSMAIINPLGVWDGETDQGAGSPRIRTNCVAGVPEKKPYLDEDDKTEPDEAPNCH